MIGVHLDGTFFCSREATARMMHSGGNILNLSSIMGTFDALEVQPIALQRPASWA